MKTALNTVEHDDAKTLHDEVKRYIGFTTRDEGSRRALFYDHETEQKGMTEHETHIRDFSPTMPPHRHFIPPRAQACARLLINSRTANN